MPLLSEDEFLIAAQLWRPWRAYAAMHLWAADERAPSWGLESHKVGSPVM